MRALIARINRKLAADGEVLKAARSERAASSVGLFFIVRGNRIASEQVDPEAPRPIDQNWCAHWRNPMDMMRQG